MPPPQPQPVKKPAVPAAPPSQVSISKVSFANIERITANRVVLYGTGGIGKTSLCLKLPNPPGKRTAFIDRDNSLGKLDPEKTKGVVAVPGIKGWSDVRAALRGSGWDNIGNIVLDTGSELQKDCTNWVLNNIKTEKNLQAQSIESYGYGKGYRHFYDTFLLLLADLDRHFQAGRNVILVCHEDRAKVPNPQGEDWLRFEPDLYQSDKISLRSKVKNWADQVLFYGYDVAVEDGVGKGSGTRTLYTVEQPHCMAKSRTCSEVIAITGEDSDPWPLIMK